MKELNENEISYQIIGSALEVHTKLGSGLLESAYESALAYELAESGLYVRTQVPMPLLYKDIKLNVGYIVDLIVEEKVLVEIKSLEKLAAVHFAQTLTYLKLSNLKLGLLINFNCKQLKDGITRLANNL